MKVENIKTLGELKKSGYKSRGIKEELRENLIEKIKKNEPTFSGIHGYEDSVIPELERAILSRHNINLLGLRGQAKTRLARLMVNLLDEYMPVVQGSEINDDPLNPISRYASELVKEKADETPISWVHREERFFEKLATPDVTVADLIGDVDPIKAANLKLSYADDRVIHFGMIPRANRSIFVINELPDLQARIQVALFNILQEGDIQIRGFKLRLPLDLQFVFTANPEDYTNRGSIVTPLKDRIGSQILTHYPDNIETAKIITAQEAKLVKQLMSSTLTDIGGCEESAVQRWFAGMLQNMLQPSIEQLSELPDLLGISRDKPDEEQLVRVFIHQLARYQQLSVAEIRGLAMALESGMYRYSMVAFTNQITKDYPQSVALREYVYQQTNTAGDLYELADSLRFIDRERAVTLFGEAAQQGSFVAQRWYGNYQACVGNTEQALLWLNKARQNEPDEASFIDDIISEIQELGEPTNCLDGWVY